MWRAHHVVPLVVAFALTVPACARGSAGSGAGVQVTVRDFEIDAPATVDAGGVTFAVTNRGPNVHEFELFSVPEGVDAGRLPVSAGVAEPEVAGLELIDEVEDIAPSTTVDLGVSLAPGTYVFICNLPGHYQQGMHATFSVR
jgi:uncharacterized cupredoxin-like copper-binding protein